MKKQLAIQHCFNIWTFLEGKTNIELVFTVTLAVLAFYYEMTNCSVANEGLPSCNNELMHCCSPGFQELVHTRSLKAPAKQVSCQSGSYREKRIFFFNIQKHP
uniref:Uncharacterized protein n=1 Tax=Rhipicephalus appendiculatus TaxID=34631 RepID=A0A131YEW8_RHIAP